MGREIVDPDFQTMADFVSSIEADYASDNTEWIESPFAWLKLAASATKGAVGKRLIERWCVTRGLQVADRPDRDCDRVIEGVRVAIKFSMLGTEGTYIFEQIRDRNYELIVFLGLTPCTAHCWVIPKDIVWEHTELQHGAETHWIPILDPQNVPPWMTEYGGTLAEAYTVLQRLVRQQQEENITDTGRT